jgi:hypothetical protein
LLGWNWNLENSIATGTHNSSRRILSKQGDELARFS